MKKGRKEEDPRFSEVVYDERYKKSKLKKGRVDDRFVKAADGFEEKLVFDKRGGVKKVKEGIKKEMGILENDVEGEEEEEQVDAWDVQKSSDEEDIDMDVVNEYLGVQEEDEASVWSEQDNAPDYEGSSRKLALLNYDWTKITSGDLMITFSSFLPAEGRLDRVLVYPSEFGIKKMEQETLEGPGDIFKNEIVGKKTEDNAGKAKSEKDAKKVDKPKVNKLNRQVIADEWVATGDASSGLDINKLRRYEKDRLKYYYAVLEFDSGKTADEVFEACNGYELEKTGIKIELRAVPEDLDFPYPPKEKCTEKPSTATSLDFLNRAMTHTAVNCTWDEPDLDNKKNELLFKEGFEDKIDLDDYIAPEIDEGVYDDDEDQDGLDEEDINIESPAESDDEEEQEQDQSIEEKAPVKSSQSTGFLGFDKKNRKGGIRITFKNPLEYKGGDDDEEENPLKKRVFSMKFNASKKAGRGYDEAEGENAEDFFENGEMDDQGLLYPPQKTKKPVNDENMKNLKFKERMKEKRRQAKLDKEKERDEKKRLKDQKYGKSRKDIDDLELIAGDKQSNDEFTPNYEDERFPNMFDDDEFAIDPTSSVFDKKKHLNLIKAKKERKKTNAL